MKTIALVLFVLMYVMMIARPKYRPYYALIAASIFIMIGILPLPRLVSAINWNVLLMISGTMIIVHYFIASQMPGRLADVILDKSPNVMWVTIYMSLFAGIISSLIDNVATVLMVAPVGLSVCKKLGINPVAMILSISVSSNLQGAATLVGDTTSIMLGDFAGMDFLDFFWLNGKPGIFFAVELGAIATIPVMMYLFRKDKEPVGSVTKTEVKDYVSTVILILMVASLVVASFIPNTPELTNGIICCTLAVITMIIDMIRSKSTEGAVKSIKGLDFQTLSLLVGLFIVIGGLIEVGVIDDFANLIMENAGQNLFVLYTIIIWGSVLISAFVDNIPYVATMLPVLAVITESLGIEPYLLYFGLLSGATLGGNITPFGASANIAAVGLLRKNRYEVSFKDFIRIGLPFTLVAVLAAYIFIWVVWA
ncbi:MAG: arsenic transporter [Mogibacterium sp.]|nr:arsenic transporter [Mogibacterium sp.]